MFITPFELPSIPASLPVYRPIRPEWTPERAARFATRFGVDAPAKTIESLYVCRNDEAVVEIFQATHSARVTRTTFDGEGIGSDGRNMPSDDAAVERGNQFIESLRDIHKSEPMRPTLSRIEAISQAPGGQRSSSRTVAIQVNYQFTLDDLPLKGPGAKAQATIGASGEIERAYLFWRQVERTGERWTTRPAAAALTALAESPLIAPVIHNRDVEVMQIQPGWLCLPPASEQNVLFPVFEIRGRLIVEAEDPRDFIVYLAAALPPQQPAAVNSADRWPAHVIA